MDRTKIEILVGVSNNVSVIVIVLYISHIMCVIL